MCKKKNHHLYVSKMHKHSMTTEYTFYKINAQENVPVPIDRKKYYSKTPTFQSIEVWE